MNQIKGLILLICAAGAIVLAVMFFSRPAPIEVSIARVTPEMVEENQVKIQEEEKRQQAQEAARKRANLEQRLYHCKTSEDCIIVDKDPCGCLRGPSGVTAINSELALEFSRLMDAQFASAKMCPSVASTEKECSAKARPVCQANRCKIVY